jgi:hypothetical protein
VSDNNGGGVGLGVGVGVGTGVGVGVGAGVGVGVGLGGGVGVKFDVVRLNTPIFRNNVMPLGTDPMRTRIFRKPPSL